MRNVISTNTHVDVSDEYAEAVDKILEKAFPMRETFQREHGLKTYRVLVAEYSAPDGSGRRWAVDYSDPASREVEEFDHREAADVRYEWIVRACAEGLRVNNDDVQETFDETDVPGVPGYQD